MASCRFSDEDWTGNNRAIMGSWPIKIVQYKLSKVSSANRTARVFRVDFPINRCSSFCKLNFQLNREEIKQFLE